MNISSKESSCTPEFDIAAVPARPGWYRQRPSHDQQILRDGRLSRGGSRKPNDLTTCSDVDMMS
jgi:hypothetical protein